MSRSLLALSLPALALSGLLACDAPYAENDAPAVKFTSIADGAVLDDGESFPIELRIVDRDGDNDLTVALTSDKDGDLGSLSGLPSSLEAPYPTFDVQLSLGEHTLTATGTDPSGASRDTVIQVTVDGLPSAPVLTLTPDPPRTGDLVRVEVTTDSVDPEGTEIVYRWAIARTGAPESEAPLDGESKIASLPASETERGQEWTATFEAYESNESGNPLTSRRPAVATLTFTIANTPPEPPSDLTFVPASPVDTDPIVCTPGAGTDADGDAVTFTYEWACDDGATCAGKPTRSQQQLPPANTDAGETWRCTATPTDGTNSGSPVSQTVFISP